MKFVDEAVISVIAGRGGDGCLSFRREKFIPRGGPDGGNGGSGASIWLQADEGLNTLVDFRHARVHRASRGQAGMGQERFGKSGRDLHLRVPVGTRVYDDDTQELLGELLHHAERLLVARGGAAGLGNCHFKGPRRRTPRHATPGAPGEQRQLRLELQLLADVGLLGLPNAGKSTLLNSISAARSRVAGYPFTTLHPQLGVVRLNVDQHFVVADIPGLIQGAAEGAGLGTHFLRHLGRTRLLLHLIDTWAARDLAAITEAVRMIETELGKFSTRLLRRPCWLVLNKRDCLADDAALALARDVRQQFANRRVFFISGATGQGCQELVHGIAATLLAPAR